MKERNPLAVFLLPFITFGIYSWYWAVKTKGEMNALGENIPTAWIWLIPFVGSLWWGSIVKASNTLPKASSLEF